MTNRPLVPVPEISPERQRQIAERLLNPQPETPAGINPADYIILPANQHESYSYPELYVAKKRLSYSPDMQQAASQLNLTLRDNNHGFIGNIQWEQALKLNLLLGRTTLNPRQYIDLIFHLLSGKVHDGTGKEIDRAEVDSIVKDILEKREPHRAEWLDAKFEEVNGVLHIKYNHRLSNGQLQPQTSETLEAFLTEDCVVELKPENFNRHGLPKPNSKSPEEEYKAGKNIYYWHPRTGYVARFGAGSGGADLGCGWGPGGSGPSLGVRSCAEGAHLR